MGAFDALRLSFVAVLKLFNADMLDEIFGRPFSLDVPQVLSFNRFSRFPYDLGEVTVWASS
jgi:hypothetical protein